MNAFFCCTLGSSVPVFYSLLQYEEVAEKDDLMGVEDTAKKDILELRGAHAGPGEGRASGPSLQGPAA